MTSYQVDAGCYLSKPVDLGQFLNVVRSAQKACLTIVKLPRTGG